jgi:ABC-type multidrug transport system ATPase subunit
MQGDKVIEVRGLAKSFGHVSALEDVSFDVHAGDVFGFLGPNGSGKSTTIRCLLSLIRPGRGDIRIFGKSVSGERQLLSRIGCIVEKPDFYNFLTAQKNLEIFARISGRQIGKSRIGEVLEFVGLNGRERDKVKGYSHGMKQRLGIAQSLMHDPDLIILDEPTTGLDPQGIVDVRNLILRLRQEHGKTVLLSSHLLSEVELIANRMVIISKGRTLVEGDVMRLLGEQELVVGFEVDDLQLARQLAEHHAGKEKIKEAAGSRLSVHITAEDIPRLNAIMVENGIRVYAIESRKKLEDYFIKLVSS